MMINLSNILKVNVIISKVFNLLLKFMDDLLSLFNFFFKILFSFIVLLNFKTLLVNLYIHIR